MDREPTKKINKILNGVYEWGKNNTETIDCIPKNGQICIVDAHIEVDKIFMEELTLVNLLSKWIVNIRRFLTK